MGLFPYASGLQSQTEQLSPSNSIMVVAEDQRKKKKAVNTGLVYPYVHCVQFLMIELEVFSL